MSNSSPMTDAELARYCELMAKLRRGNDLTTAEDSEFDLLHSRAKKKVVWPPILPPTIIIPKTHVEDFICGDPGTGGPVA